MRASIAWFVTVLLAGWLVACDGSTPPVATPVSAEITPTQVTENKLPPPVISVSTPAPIATVAAPPLVIVDNDATPIPTATPEPLTAQLTLPNTNIVAQRVGTGPFKIVLATDSHGVVAALAERYQSDPTLVPVNLSVWFVTTPSDGDILRSADTSFDGCNKNDGIDRPFDSAESLALRDFLADAAFAVFVENAPINVVHTDACSQYALSNDIANLLVAQANAEIDSAEFAFSPLPSVIGHFVDYLAGEGIGALVLGLKDAQSDLHTALADTLFSTLSDDLNKHAIWLMDKTVGKWQLADNALRHPIAIAERLGIYYILDSGRVLAIDPTFADGTLIPILASGDEVDGTRVLELLDLSTDGDYLYALDRAGDVYRHDGSAWAIDRYDRPIRDRSAHYFTALGTAPDSRRHLLENSAPLMLRYADDEKRSTLPDAFYPVDVSVIGDDAYVLLHDKESPTGEVWRYELGEERGKIRLSERLVQPRQVLATETSVFVLDRAGVQVQQFDRVNGEQIALYRFVDNRPISSLWTDGETLLLAGRDAVYLLGAGADSRILSTDHLITSNRANDFATLQTLSDFAIPIGIPRFVQRDYQMAGAPRHYRLGVHEGFDFYWQRGSQVSAAASGTVVRADWAYVAPYAELFALWRGESAQLGYTSPEAADFFGGRQVWIDYGGGIEMRYLHLSSIDPSVQIGATVERGQIIARVGNSGSPGMLVSEDEDAHLHFEIRIDEGYVGQYLRPIEARAWLRRILR